MFHIFEYIRDDTHICIYRYVCIYSFFELIYEICIHEYSSNVGHLPRCFHFDLQLSKRYINFTEGENLMLHVVDLLLDFGSI